MAWCVGLVKTFEPRLSLYLITSDLCLLHSAGLMNLITSDMCLLHGAGLMTSHALALGVPVAEEKRERKQERLQGIISTRAYAKKGQCTERTSQRVIAKSLVLACPPHVTTETAKMRPSRDN